MMPPFFINTWRVIAHLNPSHLISGEQMPGEQIKVVHTRVFGTICLRMQAHFQVTADLLRQEERVRYFGQQIKNRDDLRSPDKSKQISGLITTVNDFNSKLNKSAVSKEVTGRSMDSVGSVAQQANTGLDDVDRSMRRVFTATEQAEVNRQVTHYAKQLATTHAATTSAESSLPLCRNSAPDEGSFTGQCSSHEIICDTRHYLYHGRVEERRYPFTHCNHKAARGAESSSTSSREGSS
jgi:hypothetical protein